MYEEWGRRIKEANGCIQRWMKGEKENKRTDVYEDLLTFKNNHLRPTIEFYNKLRRQEFVRNSDYTKLDIMTEELVLAYNKLIFAYEYEPSVISSDPVATDPEATGSALVDIEILNNYQ